MKKYPWGFTRARSKKVDYQHWDGEPLLERLRSMVRDEPNDQLLGAILREYIRSLG